MVSSPKHYVLVMPCRLKNWDIFASFQTGHSTSIQRVLHLSQTDAKGLGRKKRKESNLHPLQKESKRLNDLLEDILNCSYYKNDILKWNSTSGVHNLTSTNPWIHKQISRAVWTCMRKNYTFIFIILQLKFTFPSIINAGNQSSTIYNLITNRNQRYLKSHYSCWWYHQLLFTLTLFWQWFYTLLSLVI